MGKFDCIDLVASDDFLPLSFVVSCHVSASTIYHNNHMLLSKYLQKCVGAPEEALWQVLLGAVQGSAATLRGEQLSGNYDGGKRINHETGSSRLLVFELICIFRSKTNMVHFFYSSGECLI